MFLQNVINEIDIPYDYDKLDLFSHGSFALFAIIQSLVFKVKIKQIVEKYKPLVLGPGSQFKNIRTSALK